MPHLSCPVKLLLKGGHLLMKQSCQVSFIMQFMILLLLLLLLCYCGSRFSGSHYRQWRS